MFRLPWVPKVRPNWDTWALGVAMAVSERGDCTRRQVGAVILDKDHGPVSFGYNGTYPGGPSCLKGDCPRGRHYMWRPAGFHTVPERDRDRRVPHGAQCACGKAWPCEDAAEPGSSYDTGPGKCEAVHAEMNALLQVSDRNRLVGSTMYITDPPCTGCLKHVKSTAIARIVWPGGEYVK